MEEIKKLGFGLMRLPRKGLGIDIREFSRMVDLFLEAGFTYFDTAHVYPGSEDAARKALVERYPRESYTLATKLFAPSALTEDIAKKQFITSLKRTKAEYIDYYLLHSLMTNNYKKYENFHLWDYVNKLKRDGLIRHIGFSFHSGPELLEKILKDHPEVEFVQLQINYADWENPSITSRANYEVARKYGKKITVMEPVKGGNLANPQKDVKKLLTDYAPDASCASWAIRFAASLEGILTVLSGMSNIAQMEDNISYMRDFKPLDEDEMRVIREAQRLLGNSVTIPCTACHYCTKGCPMNIPIPEIFAARNKRLGNGQIEESLADYKALTAEGPKAGDCIACGQCEDVCPQHIRVINELKKCSESFGG